MHILHSVRQTMFKKAHAPLPEHVFKYTLALPVSMYTGATVLLSNDQKC